MALSISTRFGTHLIVCFGAWAATIRRPTPTSRFARTEFEEETVREFGARHATTLWLKVCNTDDVGVSSTKDSRSDTRSSEQEPNWIHSDQAHPSTGRLQTGLYTVYIRQRHARKEHTPSQN